jgi:hypothetical protein
MTNGLLHEPIPLIAFWQSLLCWRRVTTRTAAKVQTEGTGEECDQQ